MLKTLLFIGLLTLTFPAKSYTNINGYIYEPLKLIINPSFESMTVYLVNSDDTNDLYILKGTFKDWDSYEKLIAIKEDKVELDIKEYEKIVLLTQQALSSIKLNDDTSGHDGQQWILSSNIYQDITLSIWSPYLNADKRGYNKLLKLRKHLDSFFIN